MKREASCSRAMKAEPCCTELGGVGGTAGFGRSVRDQRTLSPALLLLSDDP